MRWHVLRSPVASNTRSLDFGVTKPGAGVNILAYVHLRNIYRSTGAGRVAREMTDYLSRRPDVHMQILADPGDHARVIDKVGSPWTEFPYHFFKHETSKQQALWYLSDRPAAEDFWPGTDIVFCTAESYVPVRRAKLVVTCHDAQLFEPDAHLMSRWLVQQRFKWRLLFGKLADEASMFHTISNFAASRMARYFPRIESRLRVVPNAVSESFFHPATEIGRTVLARLGIAGRPYILVPGGLHHRKNADLILDVWPEIHRRRPDVTLVVMGHNQAAYLDRAKSLAPSLVLTGFLDEEHITALYQGAEIVWFPSRYEGFGLPVLEAMASGTPIVTSSTTAIPEVAGGAAAALVHPDQPGDQVDAVVGLLGDSAAQSRARVRGLEHARKFTWERAAGQLAGEFRRLL